MQTVISSQKEPEKIIPQNVKTPFTTTWILFLFFLVTTIIYYFLSQPELPLFYSLATKQDQLAPKVFLFLFPAISLIINILHFFIVKFLQQFSSILLKLFIGTTIALQVLVGFALIRIIVITI